MFGLVALGALGIWFVFGRRPQPAAPPPMVEPPEIVAEQPAAQAPAPSLSGADGRVRELLGRLSSAPELAAWLEAGDLIRRFTAAVNNIAEGESPRNALSFLAPGSPFQVVERDGRTVISPASHARFDPIARVLASIDVQGAAQAYRELKPLFDQAYGEIGPPGGRFEQILGRAIQHLLAVPVPERELEVTATAGVTHAYVDPALEALSPAQKHLLRMGPANIRAIQQVLRQVRDAFGLPTTSR